MAFERAASYRWVIVTLQGLFIAAIVGAVGYEGYVIYQLSLEDQALEREIAAVRQDQQSTAQNLRDTIALLEQNLSLTQSEQNTLRGIVANTQQETQSLSGTVGTLEKLTYTDKELLQKYSKIYFLNENYVPKNLSTIPAAYTYQGKDDMQIHSSVLPFLEALEGASTDPDFDLRVISAYRSFGTQANLKSSYTVTYGSGANSFSADQGYSEHQLGTTVDFTTVKTGTDFNSFDKTSDYKWLVENAYRYGFIVSYPKNNGYYQYEPWHWRFVGVELATKLHNEGKYFYDLDQREIDSYLPRIFDK